MTETNLQSPGHTAVLAAVGRGVHNEQDPAPLVRDHLALDLAGDAGAAVLAGLRQVATPEALTTLGVTFAIRARLTEDEVARAAAAGVRQYVVLGAGLDTFAQRRPDALAGVRIFEVDRPGSQAWKRARLAQLGISEPPDTVYVAVDFETAELVVRLDAAGFDRGAPAIVSWIAVTQYLERVAVEETLAFAGSLPAGSVLVMTYVVPPADLSEMERAGLAWTMSQAESRGEPFRTLMRPPEVEALLRAHGFNSVEMIDQAELQRRYLADRPELQLPRIERLVVASRG